MSRKRQQSHGFFFGVQKFLWVRSQLSKKQVHDQISRLALRSQHWMMGKLEPETPHISWWKPWFPVKIFPTKPIHCMVKIGISPIELWHPSWSLRWRSIPIRPHGPIAMWAWGANLFSDGNGRASGPNLWLPSGKLTDLTVCFWK